MSKINVKLYTDRANGNINIQVKSECSLNELRATVGYLMAGLAANTSIEEVEGMVSDIKKDMQDSPKIHRNQLSLDLQ